MSSWHYVLTCYSNATVCWISVAIGHTFPQDCCNSILTFAMRSFTAPLPSVGRSFPRMSAPPQRRSLFPSFGCSSASRFLLIWFRGRLHYEINWYYVREASCPAHRRKGSLTASNIRQRKSMTLACHGPGYRLNGR